MTVKANLATLAGAQKTAKGVPAYTLWVNRPAGRLVAAAGHEVGLTANGATYLSAVLTVVAATLFATVAPSWTATTGAVLVLAVAYVLDSADGQLARLAGRGSPAGEWLDHVIDAGKTPVVHGSLLVGAHRFLDVPEWLLLLPLLFVVVSTVMFSSSLLVDLIQRSRGRSRTKVTGTPSVLGSVLKLPADWGFILWSFVLLPAGALFWWVYGLLLAANAGYLLLHLRSAYLELSQPVVTVTGTASAVALPSEGQVTT